MGGHRSLDSCNWRARGGKVVPRRRGPPTQVCSSTALSRARSFLFARRIAAAMKGATILEKPAGSPRFRNVIRVPLNAKFIGRPFVGVSPRGAASLSCGQNYARSLTGLRGGGSVSHGSLHVSLTKGHFSGDSKARFWSSGRKAPGGRSTEANDYPAEKAVYALRDVDALIAKSKERAPSIVSRTPPTTSSSRASRIDPDSNQPSIQKIHRPILQPPSGDCILDREHDADPEQAPHAGTVETCWPRWP